MKRLLLILLFVLSPILAFAQPFGSPFGAVPPSDVPYNATTWNGSLLAPTKNAVRDKIEAIIVGGGLVDTSGVPVANDFARFTDADTIEGRNYSETLGDLSGQAGADFSMNTHKITGVVDPTTDQEAATKKYVDDSFASGVSVSLFPNMYNRDIKWLLKEPYSTAANRYTIQTPDGLSVNIGGSLYYIDTQSDIDLSVSGNWDDTTPDYTVAATRAGEDFYIYACQPASGDTPDIVLSDNSTTPTGYTTSDSRKIGGFHCLCVDVGTISGHTLTGFLDGDVLPASIWDINHRPICSPEGMVWDEKSNIWVDIYLASGTGASTLSVYGGTISDTRDWMDFVDDGGAVSKRLLTDVEFQLIATGSNEETNIAGSADPGTTGGHSDTAGTRMISNIGCEDCCGVMWQWLDEQAVKYDGAVSASWYNLPGAKGSLYRPVNTSDVKLAAGGNWGNGVVAGSRARYTYYRRWDAFSSAGARFASNPQK